MLTFGGGVQRRLRDSRRKKKIREEETGPRLDDRARAPRDRDDDFTGTVQEG